MALITCKNLSLGYEGVTVVKNISFTVEEGDYLCIVGENGSGKSTLMKTVLKLRKPLEGEIIMGDGLLQSDIGYLPQQTDIQRDFPASVEEIVFSGCISHGSFSPFYKKEDKKRARDVMEKLGILPISKKCYRELSGGQQQKVLLARALTAAGKLIFLDEPVAGLDPHSMAEMYALIKKLNEEDKVTVIMISHDIACSVKYASHVLHIGKEPLFFGTKADYLESDIGRQYIGEDEHEHH